MASLHTHTSFNISICNCQMYWIGNYLFDLVKWIDMNGFHRANRFQLILPCLNYNSNKHH